MYMNTVQPNVLKGFRVSVLHIVVENQFVVVVH